MNLRFYLVMNNKECSVEESKGYCNKVTTWTNEVLNEFRNGRHGNILYSDPNGFTYSLSALKELAPYLEVSKEPAVVFYDAGRKIALATLKGSQFNEYLFKKGLRFFMTLGQYNEDGQSYVTPDGERFFPLYAMFTPSTGPGVNPFSGNILSDILQAISNVAPWWALGLASAYFADSAVRSKGTMGKLVRGGASLATGYLAIKKMNQ